MKKNIVQFRSNAASHIDFARAGGRDRADARSDAASHNYYADARSDAASHNYFADARSDAASHNYFADARSDAASHNYYAARIESHVLFAGERQRVAQAPEA